ncbi:MAG: hypothetical protein ACM65L_23200 [Microcoleus sp.]
MGNEALPITNYQLPITNSRSYLIFRSKGYINLNQICAIEK